MKGVDVCWESVNCLSWQRLALGSLGTFDIVVLINVGEVIQDLVKCGQSLCLSSALNGVPIQGFQHLGDT